MTDPTPLSDALAQHEPQEVVQRPRPVDLDEVRVMDGQDVRTLLAKVMGYDNRRPGEWNLAAWQEAATRGRWTLHEALDAVARHHDTRPDVWLMPGHVNLLIRADRKAHADRYVPEVRTPASEEARLQAMESVRAHLTQPLDHEDEAAPSSERVWRTAMAVAHPTRRRPPARRRRAS